MARKHHRNEDSYEDTRLAFENVELQDRIARGNTYVRQLEAQIRALETKQTAMLSAGQAMYDALIQLKVSRHIITGWENIAK